MNKIILVILSIFVIVFCFTAGALFQFAKDSTKLAKFDNLVKNLNSGLVTTISVYGKVDNIDGRNITLAMKNESITALIDINANLMTPISGAVKSQTFNFSNIKKGDDMNILFTVDGNGNLNAKEAIVYPLIEK